MDFLTKLPNSTHYHSAIFFVIDMHSKQAHFIAPRDDATAQQTAKLFFDGIFRLHGMPAKIVSDCDLKFTSLFWQELFRLCGTQLAMSTARHPQTDGQTERTIQTVETYLRAFVKYNQKDWNEKLTTAEFAYNNASRDSMKLSPFKSCNQNPLVPLALLNYNNNTSTNSDINTILNDHKNTFWFCRETLKALDLKIDFSKSAPSSDNEKLTSLNIKLAQDKYAKYANKKQMAHPFKVGDFVLLSTRDLDTSQFSFHENRTLSPQFIRPYQITEEINLVAFKTRLPSHI